MRKFILPFFLLISVQHNFAQTWVDSLDTYAREEFMPPSKFNWTWMKASLLYTMVKQYDNNTEAVHQKLYFDFVKTAMDKTYKHANGKVPNAVAPGLGMAFLYRVTKDIKYNARYFQKI